MSFSYELQNEWQTCREASDFIQLPDGSYTAAIQSVKVESTQSKTGEVYYFLVYSMIVTEGEFDNASFQKRDFLNQKSLPFIKRDMLKLGVNIPQYVRDIALALQPSIGQHVLVKVRTSQGITRDFVNIDFLRVVESMPTAAPAQPAPAQRAPQQAKPQAAPPQGNPQPPITYPSGTPNAAPSPQFAPQPAPYIHPTEGYRDNFPDDDIPF